MTDDGRVVRTDSGRVQSSVRISVWQPTDVYLQPERNIVKIYPTAQHKVTRFNPSASILRPLSPQHFPHHGALHNQPSPEHV